jgi:radical SAM superfamily enzyme YgiQ (UPF0313 family)
MKTDIFLFNGFSPRRRSPGDVFLDNGIGLLRAKLEKEKMSMVLEDRTNLNGYTMFSRMKWSKPLREALDKLVYQKLSFPSKVYYGLKVKRLYSKIVKYQNERMAKYLREVLDKIKKSDTPIVGIKLWFGHTLEYACQLTDMIHQEYPDTIVVVGGPQVNCHSFNGSILKNTPFDMAVYSEGEDALVQIIKTCRKYTTKAGRLYALEKADIPNTIVRTGYDIKVNPIQPICIDDKLIPEYTREELNSKVRCHTIIDGLGCNYGQCNFCIHPCIYPKFRLRDPELIVDEMEVMLKQGIGFFTFTASNTPLYHAEKISDEILSRGLKLEYTMLSRAVKNAVDKTESIISSYRKIIKSGMRIIFMGAECGNDDVLSMI